jgi:hypothetical protein
MFAQLRQNGAFLQVALRDEGLTLYDHSGCPLSVLRGLSQLNEILRYYLLSIENGTVEVLVTLL